MGSQYGDSAFFLPSVRPDRVWVVDIDPRFSIVRAVREVTVDGVVGPQTWGIIDALEDEGPVS